MLLLTLYPFNLSEYIELCKCIALMSHRMLPTVDYSLTKGLKEHESCIKFFFFWIFLHASCLSPYLKTDCSFYSCELVNDSPCDEAEFWLSPIIFV